jgi:hypothetical protein
MDRVITLGSSWEKFTMGSGIEAIVMATACGKIAKETIIWDNGIWAERLATVSSHGPLGTNTKGNGSRILRTAKALTSSTMETTTEASISKGNLMEKVFTHGLMGVPILVTSR